MDPVIAALAQLVRDRYERELAEMVERRAVIGSWRASRDEAPGRIG